MSSGYNYDINNTYNTNLANRATGYDPTTAAQQTQFRAQTVRADSDEANNTLSFQDMLLLMVTQLQNQTIDNTADTNDMMNQIIQMTVMQAITEMSTKVDDLTEANILSYSASLVGKTVTMAILDENGLVAGEKVGEVTATGTYNGQRVIYVDGERFPINQILAVGTLPPVPTEGADETDEDGETTPTNPTTPTEPDTDENDGGTDAAEDTVEKALG